MNKKMLGFILLLVNPFVLFANEFCQINPDEEVVKIYPKNTPNYFFKVSPDGDYIYYTSGSKTYQLHVASGEEKNIPGIFDPVPAPDGKFMTSVQKNFELGYMRMNQWDVQPETNKVVRGSEIIYQSIGKSEDGKYKVATNDGEALVITYYDLIEKQGDLNLVARSKTSVSNSSLNYRLPLISKDGTEIAVFDIQKGQTVILSADAEGRVMDNLGLITGKADFSYDSRYLAFHMGSEGLKGVSTEFGGADGVAFLAILNEGARNIFVFDRQTRELKAVTNNLDENSYYPVFSKDNRIFYIQNPKNGKPYFEMRMMPKESITQKQAQVENCYEGENFEDNYSQLLGAWLKICHKTADESDATKHMLLQLKSAQCYQAVEKITKTEVRSIRSFFSRRVRSEDEDRIKEAETRKKKYNQICDAIKKSETSTSAN